MSGRNQLPYYKAYPRDFIEGTVGMAWELKGVYRVILDLIYMQAGMLPDDARYISGLLGCSVRKWNSMRLELVEIGKLQVIGDFLTNYRAVTELESLGKLQDKQSENRSNPNKNNTLQSPNADQPEPEPEPVEVSKATSTLEVEAYQDFMKAHPKPIESIAGQEAFAKLIASGVDPKQIIAAAKAYAETVKNWSGEAKIQQSDNFIIQGRGKWREHIPRARGGPMDTQTQMKLMAAMINGKSYVSISSIRPDQARDMLAAKLVTPERLAERGIQS